MIAQGLMRLSAEAQAQAQERANRDGVRCWVWYAKTDQWGREGVWYVRSETEGQPDGMVWDGNNLIRLMSCDPLETNNREK